MLLAEGFDDLLRFSQSVPGHGWEEVMLDLVVQTAIPEIGEGAGFDIAGSKHLLAQEVQRAVFVQNKHAFVVWRGDGTQVQAKKRPVDENKHGGLPDAQLGEQQANV